jgi:hypothetical protein
MNEHKNNVFLEKLNNESKKEFEKYMELLEHDDEKKNKELLLYLLFNDVVTIDFNANMPNIESSLKDPSHILENYFEKTISNISYNELNILSEVKKKFQKKKIIIANKIKECKAHLEILKKFYSNLYLEKFVSNTDSIKFLLENKSVLQLESEFKRFQLGEFFARFIFSSIESKIKNNNSLDGALQTNFYNEHKIESYIDKSTYTINKFKDIHFNFKYWLLLLNIIYQLFNAKTNFDVLFNEKEFYKHVEDLIRGPQQQKNGKKKDKKKDKHKKDKKKGGVRDVSINELRNILDNKNSKKKDHKKDNKKGNTKNNKKKQFNFQDLYNNVFNNCNVLNNKSLKKIYVDTYNINIRKYFTNQIESNNVLVGGYSSVNSPVHSPSSPLYLPSSPVKSHSPLKTIKNNISIEKEIIDPFNNKSVKIKDIVGIKDKSKTVKSSEVLTKINYNIFQFLKTFQNEENRIEINKFIKELKLKITFILFYLYNTKLKIYETYIKLIDSSFNLTNDTESTKIEETNKSTTNNNNVKIDTSKNINHNNTLNSKVNSIKAQIKSLQNKTGMREYDEKIINLEDQMKKLLIEKYLNSFSKKNNSNVLSSPSFLKKPQVSSTNPIPSKLSRDLHISSNKLLKSFPKSSSSNSVLQSSISQVNLRMKNISKRLSYSAINSNKSPSKQVHSNSSRS